MVMVFMASSSAVKNLKWSKIAVIILIIFSLSLLFSSNFVRSSRWEESDGSVKREEMALLGSQPPRCVNRCFECRPCTAALVVFHHHNKEEDGENSSYYLLAWKCKCRNKIFQP